MNIIDNPQIPPIKWNDVKFETSFGTKDQLKPSESPEIAFSGRSNVGKSSLINKLFGRKSLARVSGTPGKTVTINFYSVGELIFADLPGYGYAKVPDSERRRWSILMENYFDSGRNIKLVVQLVDMRHPPSKDDVTMLNFLVDSHIPFMVALTKSDKLGPTIRAKRLEEFKKELDFLPDSTKILPTSAEKGEGMEELRSIIQNSII